MGSTSPSGKSVVSLDTPSQDSNEKAKRPAPKLASDTEKYPGRNIPRTERLKQMREAQKKLHKKRNGELERLRDENALLRREIAKWNGTDGESICFFRDEASHYSVMHCGDKDGGPVDQTPNPDFSNVKSFRFVLTYDFNLVKKLYILDLSCVSSLFISKTTHLINKMIENDSVDMLRTTVFRFYPQFNMLTVQAYLGDLALYSKNQLVPGHWLWAENYLPKGNLLFLGIFKFLVEYSDLHRINVDILTTHLTRYAYATINGPAVCLEDLLKCICVANGPSELMFLTDSEGIFVD